MDAPRLITVEEYARMPNPDDGTLDELIDGKLSYRPLPSAVHGLVCGHAGYALADYRQRVGGAATLRCGMVVARNPDSVIDVDAAYWPDHESMATEHGWPTSPPQAAFEVVDPGEPLIEIDRRIHLLRQFGVGILWLVDPAGQEVTEYRGSSIRKFSPGDMLDGGTVLPGFTCKVDELFV